MKGLILSGGKGTRLRPLTYTSAKQLVPVANKPVLFYGLEAMAGAGITEVGIVVGDTAAEIRSAVGDGSRWGLKITYIDQDAPRGLAHAVLISQGFIGTDPFVVYLGDNLLNKGIKPFVDRFLAERPAAQILLAHVPDPQMFGVAELQDGRVVRLIEKPKEPKSDLALVGVYLFGPEVFDSVRRIRPSFRDELEITDAIQDLIDRGLEVHPDVVDGWWKDTGKLEDMLEANRLILDTIARRVEGDIDAESRIEGKVIVEPGAIIRHSVVRGPAIIGARAKILHAYVGPFTSIMNDVEIRASEIEHSIVLEGSVIADLRKPRRGQPHRQERDDSPPAGQAVGVPVHAGRQLGSGHPVVKERPVPDPIPFGARQKAPLIDGVRLRPLTRIPDERGWLMEILRADDPLFTRFGQVYVSATYPGVVKAWHYHKVQLDHFACVAGMIKLVLVDTRSGSPTEGAVNEFFIGDLNPTAGPGAEPRLSRLEVHQRGTVACRQRADRALPPR